MASTRDLILRYSANTAPLKAASKDAQKTLDSVADAGEKAGQATGSKFGARLAAAGRKAVAVFSRVLKAGVAAAGIAAGAALMGGFRSAMTQQNTEKTLSGLYGSAAAATDMMERLGNVARRSPIEYESYAKGAENLAYMGVQGKQAEAILRNVGAAVTTAGGGSEEMGRATDAMLKMVNAGKVQLDTLNQLSESGVPIFSALASHFNTNIANVREMVTSGKIGIEDVLAVVEQAEGKTFKQMQNASEQVSQSFSNQWKIAKDAVVVAIGENLIPLMDRAAPLIGRAGEAVVGFIEDFSAGTGAAGRVRDALEGFGRAAMAAGAFIGGTLVPAVRSVVGAFSAAVGWIDRNRTAATVLATIVGTVLAPALISLGVRATVSAAQQFAAWVMAQTAGARSAAVQAAAGYRVAASWAVSSSAAIKSGAQTVAIWAMLKADAIKGAATTAAANLRAAASWTAHRAAMVATAAAAKAQAFAGLLATIGAQTVALGRNAAMWVASRAAMVAAAVASRAMAAAQWLINAAMSANPIGLVITLIAGLVAGIVVAYKKSETFRRIVNAAWAGIKIGAQAVYNWFTKNIVPFFTRTLPGAFRTVVQWVRKNWPIILSILTGPIGAAVIAIIRHRDKIMGALQKLRGWAGSTWSKGWSKAKGWISKPVDGGRILVGKANNKIQSGLSRLRTWGATTWSRGWSRMKSIISDPIGSGRKLVEWNKNRTQRTLTALDGFGRKIFGKRWSGMKETLFSPIRGAVDLIRRLFGGGGALRKAFSGAVDAVGRIWGRVQGKIEAPLKFAVNTVINKGILGALRKVAGFVGMKDKVPTVTWSGLTGAARGRILPGTSSWRQGDDQIIKARRGEGVMVSEGLRDPASRRLFLDANAAARSRGTGLADYMSQHGPLPRPPGFAQGGIAAGSGKTYQPVPGRGNRHTSGYPWATWAGDYPNPTGTPVRAWKDGLVAAIKHLTTSYGKHIRMNHGDGSSSLYAHLSSILTRVGANVKAGQMIGKVGSTGNSTGPHLHFETMGKPYSGGATGGGGGGLNLPDLFGMFTRGAKKAMNRFSAFADSPYLDIVKGIPKKLIGAGGNWVKNQAGDLLGAIGANFGGDKMGIAKTIVSTAMKLGFGRRGAIIGLITGLVESGLKNVNYGDRDSLGVFQQRAPWGSRADRLNPAKAAQMFYTGGQGGQPGLRSKPWQTMGMGEAAQAVQVSAFPSRYAMRIPEATAILGRIGIGNILDRDTGGPLPTGVSLVRNNTGRQEQVVTGDQWDAITNGTSKIEIDITVQGGIVDDRTADRIAEALERRMRRKGPTRISARTRP